MYNTIYNGNNKNIEENIYIAKFIYKKTKIHLIR